MGVGAEELDEGRCSQQACLGQCQLLTWLLCHFTKETCGRARCGQTHRLGLPKAEPGPGWLRGHKLTWSGGNQC